MRSDSFFRLAPSFPVPGFFAPERPPWEWLPMIRKAVASLETSPFPPYPKEKIPPGCFVGEKVFLHPSVKLAPNCTLEGPAVVGAGTEFRPGAYLRNNVLIGENVVVGNSCEIKNALLLEGAQVPHFNYVGDSILGAGAHLGAGVILSNLRLDQAEVVIRGENQTYATGLRKCGAFLGEEAEVGCQSVLQPGTLLGRRSVVLPLLAFGGILPENTIARTSQEIQTLPRRF